MEVLANLDLARVTSKADTTVVSLYRRGSIRRPLHPIVAIYTTQTLVLAFDVAKFRLVAKTKVANFRLGFMDPSLIRIF